MGIKMRVRRRNRVESGKFTETVLQSASLGLVAWIWLLQGCASVSPERAKVDNCLVCHREQVEAFQQKEFRHASVAEGECRDCHLSFSSTGP